MMDGTKYKNRYVNISQWKIIKLWRNLVKMNQTVTIIEKN